jgi:hypothetical protein
MRACESGLVVFGMNLYSNRSLAQDNLFFENRAEHGSQKINCPNSLGDCYKCRLIGHFQDTDEECPAIADLFNDFCRWFACTMPGVCFNPN